MVRIYCGNQNPIPEDYDVMGSRYQCLRKGIGVGIYRINIEDRILPQSDPNRPKLYCGTSEDIPQGYVGMATPYQCLRKGVGVGMYIQRDRLN